MFFFAVLIEKTKTSETKIDYLAFSIKWTFLIWMIWSKTNIKVTILPFYMHCMKVKHFNICTKLLIYQRWRIKLKLLIQTYSDAYFLVMNCERFVYSILFAFLVGYISAPQRNILLLHKFRISTVYNLCVNMMY